MTVVVAEDAPLLRQGIVYVLRAAGFEVLADVGDADQLFHVTRVRRPNVAVIDIRMPPTGTDDGLRAALTLRGEQPGLGILMLSQYAEEAYARELLADGAQGIGYLLKDRVADLDHFTESVRRIAAGGTALDPEVIEHFLGRRRPDDRIATLSDRERDVLSLMAQGRSNTAIAGTLFITVGAVEKHVTSIFTRLRLQPTPEDHRRVLAVLAYLQN